MDIGQNNGEVELDFDALSPTTLWKLYDFTESMRRKGGSASPVDSDMSDSDSGDEL